MKTRFSAILGFILLGAIPLAHAETAPCDPEAKLNEDFHSQYQISFYFEEDVSLKVDKELRKKLPDNPLIVTHKFRENWVSDRLGSPKRLYIVPSETNLAVTLIPKGTALLERERPEHEPATGLTWAHEKFFLAENSLKIDVLEVLYFTNWGDERIRVKDFRKFFGATLYCHPRDAL